MNDKEGAIKRTVYARDYADAARGKIQAEMKDVVDKFGQKPPAPFDDVLARLSDAENAYTKAYMWAVKHLQELHDQ